MNVFIDIIFRTLKYGRINHNGEKPNYSGGFQKRTVQGGVRVEQQIVEAEWNEKWYVCFCPVVQKISASHSGAVCRNFLVNSCTNISSLVSKEKLMLHSVVQRNFSASHWLKVRLYLLWPHSEPIVGANSPDFSGFWIIQKRICLLKKRIPFVERVMFSNRIWSYFLKIFCTWIKCQKWKTTNMKKERKNFDMTWCTLHISFRIQELNMPWMQFKFMRFKIRKFTQSKFP
jgi:hypothetical protein